MDAATQLAWDSKIAVAVLGKGSEFVLIQLGGEPQPASLQLAEVRGYHYCGLIGYRNGKCEAVCEPGADAAFTMLHASFTFAQAVLPTTAATPDDGAAWMEKLWALPDTRDN